MRFASIAVLSVTSALASPNASFSLITFIDLDKPGVMEAIEQDQPDHHRRIAQILSVASEMPCHTEQFGRAVEARYEAQNAHCGVLLKTSLPSKRLLSFALDGTRYSTVVTMNETSKLVPAK